MGLKERLEAFKQKQAEAKIEREQIKTIKEQTRSEAEAEGKQLRLQKELSSIRLQARQRAATLPSERIERFERSVSGGARRLAPVLQKLGGAAFKGGKAIARPKPMRFGGSGRRRPRIRVIYRDRQTGRTFAQPPSVERKTSGRNDGLPNLFGAEPNLEFGGIDERFFGTHSGRKKRRTDNPLWEF